MSDRIITNPSNSVSQLLAEFVDYTQEARGRGDRLKIILDSMARDTGSGPTWDQIETELGLQVGQGETIYNLITSAMSALGGSNVTAVARMDQG